MAGRRRVMPLGLQKRLFMRLFLKANADPERRDYDESAEMDNIDWYSVLEEGDSFQDNLEHLKRNYPEYRWQTREDIEIELDTHQKWEEDFSSESDAKVYTTEIKITSHVSKAKGKAYRYGRIQLTVPEKWIGQTAKICVSIQLSEEEKSITRVGSGSSAQS